MRKCPNCGELVEDQFDACWKCRTFLDDTSFIAERNDPSLDASLNEAMDPRMSRTEIAELVCKSIALLIFGYAAFWTITSIFLTANTISRMSEFDDNSLSLSMMVMIPAITVWILGFLYWNLSSSLASRMVNRDKSFVVDRPLTIQDVMVVAFSTIGVYVLIEAIRRIFSAVWFAYLDIFPTNELWTSPVIWQGLLELALALWLMLGSRGIVRAIYWLRAELRHDVVESDINVN